jgi:hypothetical protein
VMAAIRCRGQSEDGRDAAGASSHRRIRTPFAQAGIRGRAGGCRFPVRESR